MNFRWMVLFLATMSIVFTPSLIWAQSANGTISGTVVDPSDQVIPGATVKVLNESTGDTRETTASDTGDFNFLSLLPANYSLQIEASGFQMFVSKGIVLIPNARLSVGRVKLSIGSVTETVTVQADSSRVETVSAENSALLSRSQFDMLPVRGRDLTSALRMLPGVQMTADQEAFGGAMGFGAAVGAVQGVRSSQQNLVVDGIVANDMGLPSGLSGQVNMDAVQEVTVLLSNYQAEYSGNPGAHISMSTRGGTREFHGGAYYFVRNEAFNANDFFRNRSTDSTVNSKPALYRFHTFGGTLGGPIPIPGLKDKLFFFYSYDNTRSKLPLSNNAVRHTMPTALERIGNFSQSAIKPKDPTTGQQFPNDVIPPDRIDKDMQKLMSLYPLPNVPFNGSWNYEYFATRKIPQDQNVFRIDYKITPKDQFYTRGSHWFKDTYGPGGTVLYGTTPNWPYLESHYEYSDDSLALNYTHLWGPKTVSEFTAGIRRSREKETKDDFNAAAAKGSRKGLGLSLGYIFPTAALANIFDLIPNISAGGTSVQNAPGVGFGTRFGIPGQDVMPTVTHATTLVLAKHTVKGGVFINHGRDIEGGIQAVNGALDFSNTSLNPLDSGNSFANQLLGNFYGYNEASTRINNRAFRYIFEWFVQDNWKATSKLTLDYGVRFSWATPFYPNGPGSAFYLPNYNPANAPRLFQPAKVNGVRVAYDAITGTTLNQAYISAIVPGTGSLTNGIVLKTDSGVPRGFIDQPPTQVMPRFGFAWDPFGKGKTAIRGGGGVFYMVQGDGAIDGLRFVSNQPFMKTGNMYNANASALRSGAVQAYSFPGGTYSFERRGIYPVTYNFSLGVQRDLGQGMMADVKYAGSLSRHLIIFQDINALPFGTRYDPKNQDPTTGAPLTDNLLRPYPGHGSIVLSQKRGSSNYNSLQATLNRRFASGFQFGMTYTFSKSLDYGSDDRGNMPSYLPMSRVYGRSSFDQKHVLVVNWMYDIPSLKTSRVLEVLTRGWQLSGIGSFSSGTGTGVSQSTSPVSDMLGGGELVGAVGFRPSSAGRVNLSCNPNRPRGEKTVNSWFNTSCIAMAGKGDIGNASKDVFNAPGRNNWDVTLFRNIDLGSEGRALIFRWELYNAFNHTQFGSIDTAARFNSTTGAQTNATFGQALSAQSPRQMQFSLRYRF